MDRNSNFVQFIDYDQEIGIGLIQKAIFIQLLTFLLRYVG